LAVIYAEIKKPKDVVIISKGHAAAASYAVLAHVGVIPLKILKTFGANGSTLGGHITHTGNEGIRLSTGSLGHGLPYAIGIAIAQKRRGKGERTFVVISDGECDEGTTWESALLAQQFKLSNLIVVIDRNRIQSLAGTEETMALEPLKDKWFAFNWAVREIDGHNHEELLSVSNITTQPLVVIANTTKGKGVSFMEGKVLWHYRPPSESELESAIHEIEVANK